TSYLTETLAQRLVAEGGPFDTVYVRHVVEHVSDLEGFFSALRILLRDDGFLVLELPDVEEGFALGSPAILWEEHVSYFTQPLADYLPSRLGFRTADRRKYVFGGGSLAFVAQKTALPVACSLKPPSSPPTLDLLNRFVTRLHRQTGEMRDL